MSKHLQRDLEGIERELLALSAIAEEMIAQACFSLIRRQVSLAEEVVRTDGIVDEREVKIEEDCLKILALHQPVASDLRRVAAVLKINNDLERIGDLAVNIAETAQRLMASPPLTIPEKLQQMSTITQAMVGASLDAFVQMNVVAAADVCRRDDEVDSLRNEVERELLEIAQQQPECLHATFRLGMVAQYLERIADHATNIAEDAIYLVGGEIARHRHDSSSRLRLLNPGESIHEEAAHLDRRGRSSTG